MRQKIILGSVSLILLMIAFFIFYLPTKYVPPILMYHHIDDQASFSKLSVSPKSFQRQMQFLKDHHYQVLSLEELVLKIQKKEQIPPKTIALTFDDGYLDNYTNAYPILKKFGFPAIFFVVPSKIENPQYKTGPYQYMSWAQLKEMKENGLTIGSHTLNEVYLPHLSSEEILKELTLSKKILEERLGTQVKFLCYPGGGYNQSIKKLAREADYLAAVATNPGPRSSSQDLFALKRVRISRTSDNLLAFWLEASGYYTFIKEIRDEP